MPPVDPSNGCLSMFPNFGNVGVRSGIGRENSDFCLIFGIPSWLMPLRDRSGLSWLNASTWSERPKYFCGSLEPAPLSGAHTALTFKRGRSLGASKEVWFHWFSAPFTLSSLPLHTPLFPFFFHVLLSSCLVISSFSSFAAHIGPGLSVYVHFYIHFNTGFRSPRSLQ